MMVKMNLRWWNHHRYLFQIHDIHFLPPKYKYEHNLVFYDKKLMVISVRRNYILENNATV